MHIPFINNVAYSYALHKTVIKIYTVSRRIIIMQNKYTFYTRYKKYSYIFTLNNFNAKMFSVSHLV